MEIILKKDIIGLGEEGDLKNVAPGYARNWLLPKGFAMLKTVGNLKWLEKHQVEIDKRKEEKSFEAKSVAEKLDGVSVTLKAKVSGANRLYGSIHAHQISLALKEQNIEIDHRKIEITHPIKTVGEHEVLVKLYEGVQAAIKVNVQSIEEDETTATPISEEAPSEVTKTEVTSSTEEVTKSDENDSDSKTVTEENSDQKVAE